MSELTEQLGVVFSSVIPELEAWRFGGESFATCSDCAMRPRDNQILPEHRLVFKAESRCCTYHPDLPNFLAGRALRRGGIGAAKIRARLEHLETRYATGIVRPPELEKMYQELGKASFGNTEELTCPYWTSGTHNCTIYADRNAVCRTWHCKSVDGARGHGAWTALRWLLLELESILAKTVTTSDAPAREAPLETWVEWYIACAERVDQLEIETLKTLRTPRLELLISEVARAVQVRDATLPEVVAPSVADWFVETNGVALTAWSGYDLIDAPTWIFELLSRMDGTKTWRAAKSETEAAIGTTISDDLIHTLHRRGLLSPPDPISGSGVQWQIHEAPGIENDHALQELAKRIIKAMSQDEKLEPPEPSS
jgi:Fe-S-cluster containining protein